MLLLLAAISLLPSPEKALIIGQTVISLREGLEAGLIVSIILAYLHRTNRRFLSKYIWSGVYLSVATSIVLGSVIFLIHGSLPGPVKTLFEGIAAWLAVLVLSTMIYWMAVRGRHIKKEIEVKLEEAVSHGTVLSLVSFTFVVVFREGLETVLFLIPFLVSEVTITLAGASLGLLGAIFLAYIVFVIGMKINLRRFFYFTSVLLILLAGGLAAFGTHELIEYAEKVDIKLDWLAEKAYVLPIAPDNLFHHKNVIGSILAVMFGYTVQAEWARVLIQTLYLAIALPLVIRVYRSH